MVTAMTISAAAASGVFGRVSAMVVAPKERAISTASITGFDRPLLDTAKTASPGSSVAADIRCW